MRIQLILGLCTLITCQATIQAETSAHTQQSQIEASSFGLNFNSSSLLSVLALNAEEPEDGVVAADEIKPSLHKPAGDFQ
jgi:hypothetical protein